VFMDNQSYRFPLAEQEPTDRPRAYFRLIFSSAREITSPRERTIVSRRVSRGNGRARAPARVPASGDSRLPRVTQQSHHPRSIPGERVLRHPRVPRVRERLGSVAPAPERVREREREREPSVDFASVKRWLFTRRHFHGDARSTSDASRGR